MITFLTVAIISALLAGLVIYVAYILHKRIQEYEANEAFAKLLRESEREEEDRKKQ